MATRTNSHTISHAENLFSGDAYVGGADGRGIPRLGVVVADFGTPIILDADGIAAAQAAGSPGDLTLNGALAAGGAVDLDVARTLQIVSSGADSTQTLTITGTDAYGQPMVEEIAFNTTTPVFGGKAFKTISQISIDIAAAGNVSVGTSDALGLPFAIENAGDAFLANEAGAVATIGTIVGAVTTNPATAITGDVRGTYNPTVVLDGSTTVKLYYFPAGRNSILAYGVPQFAG